jgi:D-xylulose reductase
VSSYPFTAAANAFKATKAGKSEDGKAVIKAIISGPDVSPVDI